MQQIPEAILDAIEAIQVPPMPQVLLHFLNAVNDDQVSIPELAEIVGQDPALSARILTVANSPALRSGAEIRSLRQGVAALGIHLMKPLAACLAIQSVFARTAGDMRYNLTGFWGHSLLTAELAQALAYHLNYPDPEEAYLAGLLHDVGQLLLLGGMGDSYGVLLDRCADEATLQRQEGTLLGTDHAAVGTWLIDQWKLSSFMADAVLFHHRTAEEIANADLLSKIVWAAHCIGTTGKTNPPQGEPAPPVADITSLLGITASAAAAILKEAAARVDKLATALDIPGSAHMKPIPYFSSPFESFRSKLVDNDMAHSRMEAAVRDMATMHSLQQNLTELDTEAELVMAVRESARILFGIGRIAFLFVQPDRNVLSGANVGGQPELFRQLEIRLDPGQSLAAAVVLAKKPYSTFDDERPAAVSLVDIQIARVLGCEGVLYVPMWVRAQHIGVMAYGTSASRYARIRPRLDGMARFANLAADSIAAWRDAHRREQELEASLASRYEQQAHKVAHEAGNPLTIIKNYLKIISRKLPYETGVHQELTILGEEIDRVTQIVRSLGTPGKPAPAAGSFDVNAVIGEMLALYGETFFSANGIKLVKSLEPNLAPVAGDRDSFKQILFNLWKNASEAMPDGGHLILTTRGNIVRDEQRYMEFHIRDSGPGLPQEVLQCLFQPLPPDRRPGHSGIGLSIVASLVKGLGGRIDCQSQAGQGTSFSILLPQPGEGLKK